jgi:putative ABC transport system permease protein
MTGTVLLRLYRLLLLLYPRHVRERDGREMLRLFSDLVEQERKTDGRVASLKVAARSFVEAPWSALREHRRSHMARRSRRPETKLATVLDTVGLDLRFAVRTFRKRPGFTAVCVLTLALGIGTTTSMFSIVHASLIRALPFPDPDRLVMLYLTRSSADEPPRRSRWSYPEFELLRQSASGFANVAAYSVSEFNLAGDAEPEHMEGEVVSAVFFDVLGVSAAVGRTFAADEDVTPGSHPVAVLGHALWRRRFGGDSTVVGRTVRINRVPMTVVGVMPQGFRGLSGRADLWIPQAMGPLSSYPGQLTDHQHFHNVVARLAPDVALRDVVAHLQVVGNGIAAVTDHEGDAAWSATALPLHEVRVDPTRRRPQLLLFGAAGFVLLIACANLVNLLLARSASRERETTIRLSLGSTRGRLVRQLLTESVVLSVAGGILGVAFAVSVTDTLAAFLPERLPSGSNNFAQVSEFAAVGVDMTVLLFAVSISLGAGLLFGMAPALRATRTDLAGSLKERVESAAMGYHKSATSGLLIVSEFALAAILSVGAALLLTTYARLQSRDTGFNADNVLTFWIQPPLSENSGDEASRFLERVLAQVSQVPGVQSATVSLCTPLMGCARHTLQIADRARTDDTAPVVGRHYVGPQHFETLRIPIIRGRAFTPQDRQGQPRVAIISATAARRFWPNQDPIGQRVWFGLDRPDDPNSSWQIVGIVGDVQYRAIEASYEPDFYTPYLQFTRPYAYVMLRSPEAPEVLVPVLRNAVAAVDSELPIHDVQTLQDRVGTALAKSRFNALLLGGFAALALALAAIGIYGVMAHFVAQRTSEMGIRIALGAQKPQVYGLVLRRGGTLVAIGIAVGAFFAVILVRLLSSLVYEVSVTDPRIFFAVTAVLTVVALLACYLPARRATRVDPVQVLRVE